MGGCSSQMSYSHSPYVRRFFLFRSSLMPHPPPRLRGRVQRDDAAPPVRDEAAFLAGMRDQHDRRRQRVRIRTEREIELVGVHEFEIVRFDGQDAVDMGIAGEERDRLRACDPRDVAPRVLALQRLQARRRPQDVAHPVELHDQNPLIGRRVLVAVAAGAARALVE
jgi:hypothetical protein